MKLSKHGLELIKRFEGCELTAYKDAVGVPTIGYGHTLNVKMGQKITALEADKLLCEDVAHFEQGVMRLIQEMGISVTQNQFDALVSFAFNLGLGNLRRSTLVKKLYLMKQTDTASQQAVACEFLRWNKAGGKVLLGLTRRRQAEHDLFLSQLKE
ncbi:lysozyme [Pasteurella multocida]